MTSGQFTNHPIHTIIVDREDRQRRSLEKIEELAESIKKTGLINPIVITREGVLVAGERRLAAHKHLGFDTIAVQFTDELDKKQLHLIELEENVKRVDLPWQDHVRAIAKYHELQKELDPEWNQVRTAESLGMSDKHIGRYMLVNKMLIDQVPEVLDAPKFSVASNFAERKQERSKSNFMRELVTSPTAVAPSGETGPVSSVAPERYAKLLNTDFLPWSKTILERPFNLIHCDFPYGVNAGNTKGQSSAKTHGGYSDKPEDYFNLLSSLLAAQDNFIAPSAHMIFWYSMDFYTETVELIRAAGWRVDPFPLIWLKSDNVGILPDSNRGPRRIYETALFCTRGDRKVVRAVGNGISCATTKNFHMSEKAETMLEHFFRMLVDETTYMLDPTCGSGNSVKVAEQLGAAFSLGIERDLEFYSGAMQNLALEA